MFATTPDGVALWWEQLGDGTPVVLIPGRGDSTDLFPLLFTEALTDAGFSVVRMDPRDTGLSGDGGDEYTLSTMAADIVTILDAAEVEAAHTVAISMGGMITVDLVKQFPDRVLSSVFIAAMSPDPDAGFGPDFFASEIKTSRVSVLAQLMGSPNERDLAWLASEDTRATNRAPARPKASGRHMAASMRFGWPELHHLTGFLHPSLVVHGTEDRLLPIAHAHAFASGIAHSELHVIDGMGHLPTRSEWEIITPMLSAYLHNIDL